MEFLIFLLLIGIFSAALILAFAYFIFRGGNKTLSKSELSIGGKTVSVEVARSALEKMRGLSGRESLGENEGMLFIFSATSGSASGRDKAGRPGFWMKDMKFPIDMIWIKQGKVAGFSENAVPEPEKQVWSLKIYYPPDTADEVLEVNAGFVAKNGIQIGDETSPK